MSDLRDELARIIVEATEAAARADREYADLQGAMLLVEWVQVRKNPEVAERMLTDILWDGCGLITRMALKAIQAEGFPLSVNTHVRRRGAGRPKGSKEKEAVKKRDKVGQMEAMLARLRDPHNASKGEITAVLNWALEEEKFGGQRPALRLRFRRYRLKNGYL
jgi:hypothetical protein